MFDVATRPQPNSTNAGAVFGVPFDWRLSQPAAPAAFPWTNFGSPTGAPEKFTDVLATYALHLEDTLQTAIIISLFGSLIGVVLGVGAAAIANVAASITVIVTLGSILLAFSVAAAIGVFFGFYPASKAAHLNPIDALRYQ